MSFYPLSFDPVSFDPLSFDPMSFDPVGESRFANLFSYINFPDFRTSKVQINKFLPSPKPFLSCFHGN